MFYAGLTIWLPSTRGDIQSPLQFCECLAGLIEATPQVSIEVKESIYTDMEVSWFAEIGAEQGYLQIIHF